MSDKDPLKEVREGVDQWLKVTCYLLFIAWGFDMLQYLPVYIAEKIVAAVLAKVGL